MRRFVMSAVGAAFVVVASLLVLSSGLSASLRAEFGDVVSCPLAVIATVCCGVAARRSAARTRLGWALLAAACCSWALAEASWAIASYVPSQSDLPGPDDVFYLIGIPFAVAALATFPGETYRGRHRLRSVLDGVTVAVSIYFVFGAVLGPPTVGAEPTISTVIAFLYPLSDMALLGLALSALIRGPRSAYVSLMLIAAAMLSFAVGDGAYVAFPDYGSGGPIDLTWILSYALIAVAAMAPGAEFEPTPGVLREYRVSAVPWLVVGIAQLAVAVVAICLPRPDGHGVSFVITGAVVVLAFAVRQAWLLLDVLRLNKIMHHQLARSSEIARSVVDGIVVANRRGLIRYANDNALALLGRDADSLLGSRLLDLVRPSPTASDGAAQVVAAIDSGTALTQGTASFPRADGSEIPVELSVGPFTMDGRLAGVAVVFRDITARQAVERMKNEFMSVISHELRTPLTSIRGALAMLDGGMGGPLQPAGSRMVTLALQSSERLSRLINDILDVERLESGTLRLNLGPHDASRLVENAVHEMSGMATPAEITLTVGPVDGRVQADPDRVVQTLTNLIGNAIKFSPAGSEVVVSATAHDSTPPVIEFSVADRGRGIPAAKRDRIFDRFEQVDSSDARRHGGTGLGLAICRDIVALHGGRIWVVGDEGAGSDFRFTLPVAEDPVGSVGGTEDEPGVSTVVGADA